MKQYGKGFSLFELLVTLGIISIIAAIGAPSFQGAIRSSRLTTNINEFSNALSSARSEAIKHNRYVVVRRTGAQWESGWQIFIDIDRTPDSHKGAFNDNGDTTLCEATEDCVLKVYPALPNGYTLRPNISDFADFIAYAPSGIKSSGTSGRFILCDTNSSSTPQPGTSKVLVLNAIGRPRMAIDSNNNGIPEVDRGTDITACS